MAKAKTTAATKRFAVSNISLGRELVLGALIAELVGTFVLTFAVLNTQGNAIVAALTVLVLVLVLSRLSGGNVNPAVTIGLLVTRQLSAVKAAGYIIAQVLGAMLAVVVAAKFLKNADPNMQAPLFTLFDANRQPGEWKPIFGELIGALALGFGVAAAFIDKRADDFARAFTIGGSLLIGLVIATSGSYAVLNPAVALAAGGFAQGGWWSFGAYGLAPLVGGALGAWLYQLLRSDVDTASNRS